MLPMQETECKKGHPKASFLDNTRNTRVKVRASKNQTTQDRSAQLVVPTTRGHDKTTFPFVIWKR